MLDRQICEKCKRAIVHDAYPNRPFDDAYFKKHFDAAWDEHGKVLCHRMNSGRFLKKPGYLYGASWLDVRFSPPKECDFILEQVIKTKA